MCFMPLLGELSEPLIKKYAHVDGSINPDGTVKVKILLWL
jgi:hypothetical protein